MYIIRGKVRGSIAYKPTRSITHKSLTVIRPEPKAISTPTIDVEQSGSGMQGVKNKLSQIALHPTEGKKKYNKFISLEL